MAGAIWRCSSGLHRGALVPGLTKDIRFGHEYGTVSFGYKIGSDLAGHLHIFIFTPLHDPDTVKT